MRGQNSTGLAEAPADLPADMIAHREVVAPDDWLDEAVAKAGQSRYTPFGSERFQLVAVQDNKNPRVVWEEFVATCLAFVVWKH